MPDVFMHPYAIPGFNSYSYSDVIDQAYLFVYNNHHLLQYSDRSKKFVLNKLFTVNNVVNSPHRYRLLVAVRALVADYLYYYQNISIDTIASLLNKERTTIYNLLKYEYKEPELITEFRKKYVYGNKESN